MMPPFHFAYHVDDLMAARAFYGGLLGCAEGRSTETWVDFDFFGHQISLHFGVPFAIANTGKVGNHLVPMPHFGVVLPYATWRALADRLEEAKTFFLLALRCVLRVRPASNGRCFSLTLRATQLR